VQCSVLDVPTTRQANEASDIKGSQPVWPGSRQPQFDVQFLGGRIPLAIGRQAALGHGGEGVGAQPAGVQDEGVLALGGGGRTYRSMSR